MRMEKLNKFSKIFTHFYDFNNYRFINSWARSNFHLTSPLVPGTLVAAASTWGVASASADACGALHECRWVRGCWPMGGSSCAMTGGAATSCATVECATPGGGAIQSVCI